MPNLEVTVAQEKVSVVASGNSATISVENAPVDLQVNGLVVQADTYAPDSLQERFTDGYARGIVELPLGNIVNNATVTTENKLGLIVQGCGGIEGVPTGSQYEGSHSTIHRTSNGFTGEVINVRGGNVHFKDMTVIGNNHAGSLTGKNSAAFLVSAGSDTGTGSGNHTFDHCKVRNCEAAFQFGEDIDDPACDRTKIIKPGMYLCNKGIYQVNRQSISVRVDEPEWNYDGHPEASVVYTKAGGDVTLNAPDILSACRIFTFDQEVFEVGIGPNNGLFVINGGKFDNHALGSTLVYLTGAAKENTLCRVTIRDLHIAGDSEIWNAILLYLGGGMEVVLEHCVINPNVETTVQWNTTGHVGRTRLLIQDCIIAINASRNILKTATSDGQLTYESIRNYLPSGTRIPDWRGIVTGSL